MKIQNVPVRNFEESKKTQTQEGLQTQLHDSNTALQAANQRVQAVEAANQHLEGAVQAANQRVQAVEAANQHLESEVQAANQRVQHLEATNQHLEGDVLALQEEVERLKKELQTQTLQHVHPDHLALAAQDIQAIDAEVTSSVVGEEPVAHLLDQELDIVVQEEPPADLEGPSCDIEDQDQNLGHDSSWDHGAAYSYDDNPDNDAMSDTTTNNTAEQR